MDCKLNVFMGVSLGGGGQIQIKYEFKFNTNYELIFY